MTEHDELNCTEVVELITDYLEGALPSGERTLVEEHLVFCDGCVNYVKQVEQTIRVAGALREEDVDPSTRAALLAAFRGWRSERR